MMKLNKQIANDTDEQPQQENHPVFQGIDSDLTLVEKHGTGLSETGEGDDHGEE